MPIVRIGSWLLSAKRAVVLVPETPMNENHLPVSWQHDIGRSRQVSAVQAVAVAHAMHEATHDELRLRVGFSDAAHMRI